MVDQVSPFKRQKGAVLVFVTVGMIALLGFSALAVDGGFMYVTKTKLQQTADAAALAGASQLPNTDDVLAEAKAYADKNMPSVHNGDVLADADVTIGSWDSSSRTFTAGGSPSNAVRVVTRRSAGNGNALPLFFRRIWS